MSSGNVIAPYLRELVYVHVDKLIHSNTPNEAKVGFIAAHFDWTTFGVLPVYRTKNGYLLTDGNHRMEAARKCGHVWIPCVQLTKAEYEHVKCSKRTADVYFKIPENPVYIK